MYAFYKRLCLVSFPEKMANWVSSSHYLWVLFAEKMKSKPYCSTSISFLQLNLSHAAVMLFFYMVFAAALLIRAVCWSLHYSLAGQTAPLVLFGVFSGFLPAPIGTSNLTTSLQESVLKEKSNNGCSSRAVKRQRWRVWPVLLWWSRAQGLLTRSSQLLGTITTLGQWLPGCYWVCATL